jgi:glutaredoxin
MQMRATAWLLLLCASALAQAQNTYRWVDAAGKVHYGDRPPPSGAREVQEKRLAPPAAERSLPYEMRQAAASYPVTLYVSNNCGDGCAAARDYLARRGVPFAEKSVDTPEDFDALEKLLAGNPLVPTLQVGSKTAKGWLQDAWQRLLDAASYPPAR